jgi:DNA-binding CsgD family transcriptional regulator
MTGPYRSPLCLECLIPHGEAEHLLERQRELRDAADLLSAARAGGGGALLVQGPAGIGKSALLRAIRARGEADGFSVLAARGAELEREFSFGVVRQLFEPVLAAAGDDEREVLLAGAARLAEPAIGQLEPAAPADASPSLDPSFSVLHGLYWLTANAAERSPLLIAVDDAQWSDAASLRFLAYLTGRLEGLAVMLAVGVRPFEPGSAGRLLAALEAEPSARVVAPAALSEAATDALVRARLGSEPAPGFARACHRASGGNPQLIRELLAALAADGADPTPAAAARVAELRANRIAASVLARVRRLGEPVVAVAHAVAVLARDASPELVGELAGVAPAQTGQAVDALRALEILAPGEPLAFVHPIVRTAAYNDIAPATRGEAHRRAAHLLSERGASLESVAAQLVAAPPGADPWAVDVLTRAGEAALSRGAPEAAVSCLERALAESPSTERRREILIGLGRGAAMVRDGRRSITRLTEALALTHEPRARAEIVHLLISMLGISRAAGRGIALLERELSSLPEDERELGLLLESDIDAMSFFSLNAKRAAEGRERRFDDPDDPGLLASSGMVMAIYAGPAARAVELAQRAWARGRLLEREGPDAPTVWMVAWALLYAHELHAARAVADVWLRAASRRGSLRAFSLASSLRTRISQWTGDLADAEADARAFLEGMPEAVGAGPAFLSDALVEQGRLDEAARALGLADRAHVQVEWSFFYPMLLQSRGVLNARQGRPNAALENLLEAGRAAEQWGIATPGPLQWRPHAAEALAALGEAEEARHLLEPEIESCLRFGSPRALGIALRAAGAVAGGEQGVETLAEAVSVLRRSEAKLELARALVALGAALRRGRRVSEARTILREGLALARARGAVPLAEQAHEELTATGARPRKIVRAGVEALTASERRVTLLAAGGMTNKEIAQALFVTVRTVEAHLHHAYQKLEISSRAGLADALESGH